MNNLQGKLLVASPHLSDTEFAEAVVMVVEHTSDGAVGVLVNRPASPEMLQDWQAQKMNGESPGPVVIMQHPSQQGDLELGTQAATLPLPTTNNRLGQDAANSCRIFLDIARWQPGELEAEMQFGVWHSAPLQPELIFDEPDEIWANVLASIGQAVLMDVLGIDGFPEDPQMN